MSYLYEIYENPFLKTKTNSHTQAKKIAKFGRKKNRFLIRRWGGKYRNLVHFRKRCPRNIFLRLVHGGLISQLWFSLSPLLVSMNLIWVFKNTWYILLFSYLENLYHAKGRGRYERTPNGVHFAVFPIYMPLVNENLDFKITNIRIRFFTKTGHKCVFLCKNVLKFL